MYDKIASEIKQHVQMVALPPGNSHFVQLHSLLEAVLLARSSREIVSALALLQKVCGYYFTSAGLVLHM